MKKRKKLQRQEPNINEKFKISDYQTVELYSILIVILSWGFNIFLTKLINISS